MQTADQLDEALTIHADAKNILVFKSKPKIRRLQAQLYGVWSDACAKPSLLTAAPPHDKATLAGIMLKHVDTLTKEIHHLEELQANIFPDRK